MGERIRPIRARPWPERPVSEANKSGRGAPGDGPILPGLDDALA